jgi:predicted ABC-type ATPase
LTVALGLTALSFALGTPPAPLRAEPAATAADPASDFAVDPESLAAADALIQEPASDADLSELLKSIEKHPYHVEVMRRLRLVGDLLQANTARKNKGPDGKYTPERARLHTAIVEAMLNPAAKVPTDQRPVAIVVVGLPGSGKTTVEAYVLKQLKIECTAASADDVQSRLPEYRGWNADLLHLESRDVVEDSLLPRAIAERHNLLIEGTGRDPARAIVIVDSLSHAGYDVHLIRTNLPAAKAAYRAWHRFRRGAFQLKLAESDSGRFISPRFIATFFGTRPAETYQKLKSHPAVIHWVTFDTSSTAPGQTPNIEEEGPPAAGPRAK